MAEIGARGTEKGKEISVAEILKTLVYRSLSSPASPTSVGIKAHEILSEKAPLEYGGWDVLYEAPSQSAARRGLKFVGELELSEVKSQVDDLNAQVESVVSELQQCKEGISAILNELNELREKPITKQTELFEIDEALEVIRPIPVVIEEYDDEVIATFPEIEAFGAGLCEAEAIINLKNEIRKIFFELEGVSDDKLGKLPLSWKRVLLKVVKKIGDAR
jgi:hypothetical protein